MNLKKLNKIIGVAFFAVVFISSQTNAQDDSNGRATSRSIFTTYTPPKKSVKKASRVAVSKSKALPVEAKKIEPKGRKPVVLVAKVKKKVVAKPKAGHSKLSDAPVMAKKIGKPGALIKVESVVNENESVFSPITTVFNTGDHFRLHFQVNFPAYVALVNRGSEGSLQLLFPCKNENNFIQPTDQFQVPKGSNTFYFSGASGEENLTLLMSSKPIKVVEKVADVCASNLSTDDQTAMRSLISEADLKSKRVTMSNDKDESNNLASYFFSDEKILQNTVSLKIKLVHK